VDSGGGLHPIIRKKKLAGKPIGAGGGRKWKKHLSGSPLWKHVGGGKGTRKNLGGGGGEYPSEGE